MYHPHTRPLSTLPAAFFDLSSALHSSPLFRSLPLPSPAALISSRASPLAKLLPISDDVKQSMAGLLTAPPLHVDTVAKAVVRCVMSGEDIRTGAQTIQDIQRLAGFNTPGTTAQVNDGAFI